MNARTRAAEKLVMKRARSRVARPSILRRLVRADENLLLLFPENVANNLTMVGVAILYSGALVFCATVHLVLMHRLVEGFYLLWILAVASGGLFLAAYLSIAHFLIGLARLAQPIRQLSLIGALVLSVVFSFVCSESVKERAFADEIAAEVDRVRDERQMMAVTASEGERNAHDEFSRSMADRKLARERVSERLAGEMVLARVLLFSFFFFVAWAPFFVLQAVRNSDYGCLFETIEETNRLVNRYMTTLKERQ